MLLKELIEESFDSYLKTVTDPLILTTCWFILQQLDYKRLPIADNHTLGITSLDADDQRIGVIVGRILQQNRKRVETGLRIAPIENPNQFKTKLLQYYNNLKAVDNNR
jgi:hypothetical protein